MALAFSVTLAQAGCSQSMPVPEFFEGPEIRVTNNGQPFAMWEGALARKAADVACGGRVNVSIYDRFDRTTGEWVYPEGCA
jgi:hypothetical protein